MTGRALIAKLNSLSDESQQEIAWKVRLLVDLIGRRFDDQTLEAMLNAGLDKAHEEGIRDAAELCRMMSERTPHLSNKHALDIAAEAIADLAASQAKSSGLRALAAALPVHEAEG